MTDDITLIWGRFYKIDRFYLISESEMVDS